MTWSDGLFGALLAAFCIGGLLVRRWMVGVDRKPDGPDHPPR